MVTSGAPRTMVTTTNAEKVTTNASRGGIKGPNILLSVSWPIPAAYLSARRRKPEPKIIQSNGRQDSRNFLYYKYK